MSWPRGADGSHSIFAFLHLRADSDSIDAGLNIDHAYADRPLGLGAFETPEPATTRAVGSSAADAAAAARYEALIAPAIAAASDGRRSIAAVAPPEIVAGDEHTPSGKSRRFDRMLSEVKRSLVRCTTFTVSGTIGWSTAAATQAWVSLTAMRYDLLAPIDTPAYSIRHELMRPAMIATRHTQSLTDFRQKATETLDRLNRTGEAEMLTVNGEARAVLLSPAVFDDLAREAQLTRDVATIRKAMKQIDDGEGMTVDEAFDPLRAELLAMKQSGLKKAPTP